MISFIVTCFLNLLVVTLFNQGAHGVSNYSFLLFPSVNESTVFNHTFLLMQLFTELKSNLTQQDCSYPAVWHSNTVNTTDSTGLIIPVTG